jgi:hypothetical protein
LLRVLVMAVDTDPRKNRPRKLWLWATATFAVVLIAMFAIAFWAIASAPRLAPVRAVPVRSAPPPKSAEEALAPINGASNVVRQGGAFESFGVDYTLQKGYPPKGVIEQISSRLEAHGWRPLKQDWLNPGMNSSHVTGWSAWNDVTDESAPLQVLNWHAQWQNDAGDLIAYRFNYSYPLGASPAQQTLDVDASWYPAAGRAEMQRSLETTRSAGWRHRLTAWLHKWLRL